MALEALQPPLDVGEAGHCVVALDEVAERLGAGELDAGQRRGGAQGEPVVFGRAGPQRSERLLGLGGGSERLGRQRAPHRLQGDDGGVGLPGEQLRVGEAAQQGDAANAGGVARGGGEREAALLGVVGAVEGIGAGLVPQRGGLGLTALELSQRVGARCLHCH